jgi:hypothetical protein
LFVEEGAKLVLTDIAPAAASANNIVLMQYGAGLYGRNQLNG